MAREPNFYQGFLRVVTGAKELKIDYDRPVYTIGVVAKLLGVCTTTLRIWESKGLITAERLGKNRYYSNGDIDKLQYIKMLLSEKRMNISGIRELLKISCCWDIKKCDLKKRNACPMFIQFKERLN